MKFYRRLRNHIILRGTLKDFRNIMCEFDEVRHLERPREIIFQFIIFITEIEKFSQNANIPQTDKYSSLLNALNTANGREKGYNVAEINGYISATTLRLGEINGLEFKTVAEWLKEGKITDLDTVAKVQAKPFILKNALLIAKEIDEVL